MTNNGGTMKSSCAPYKYCKKGGSLSYRKNINNGKLRVCSTNPMTGFYRDLPGLTDFAKLDTYRIKLRLGYAF